MHSNKIAAALRRKQEGRFGTQFRTTWGQPPSAVQPGKARQSPEIYPPSMPHLSRATDGAPSAIETQSILPIPSPHRIQQLPGVVADTILENNFDILDI